MLFKDKEELIQKVKQGKDYLNKTFDTEVEIFVAPSNAIDKKGIIAVENSDLNFSGIIRHGDRQLSFKYCMSYIKDGHIEHLQVCNMGEYCIMENMMN